MKLTITTLVIIEGSYIQGIFHSLEEHPGKAYQELVDQVENTYGYDADKDHVPLHFKTIQDIENYFELVHIETQELTSTGFKTAILKEQKNYNMEPIITINEYPIGWEWLDKVPLEDFTWLIEIFSTITDNTDTYDFATFDKEATNGEPPYPVIEINRKGLANFLNDDQGYESGISMYGHYIVCKSLDISSEEEYMNQFTDIKLICNEL